jgi:acyl dehydratase
VVGTLLRAALPSIPVVNLLPGVRKTGGDPTSLHEVRTATVSRDLVTAYAAVCGFPVKDTAPATFPHILAFPLHLAVRASPAFPFPALGTIHLENSLTQHRPIAVGETVQVDVQASAVRAHPKGQAVDFLARVRVGEETVWESTSTYLKRGGGAAGVSTGSTNGGVSTGSTSEVGSTNAGVSTGSTSEAGSTKGDRVVVPGRVTWSLPGDTGRRYAAVSGDHNPIHLYALTARALGFPRQIAHGMWSLARCVAALENRLPDAVTVDAAFKRPILLPGSVAFGQDTRAGGLDFALTSPRSGAPHVLGRTRSPS